jgi:hypothetical protein
MAGGVRRHRGILLGIDRSVKVNYVSLPPRCYAVQQWKIKNDSLAIYRFQYRKDSLVILG